MVFRIGKQPKVECLRRAHQELWVPAEQLDAFNAHIVGAIRVIEAFPGPKFKGRNRFNYPPSSRPDGERLQNTNLKILLKVAGSPRQDTHAKLQRMSSTFLSELTDSMVLGSLLEKLREHFGSYDLIAHWQQGEFHHDIVLRVENSPVLPGPILVVSTNCNGGIKQVLCLARVPERLGLWHWRCPENKEFFGVHPVPLERMTTVHWFDPCELLLPTARSELREEFRERQCGGGWQKRP